MRVNEFRSEGPNLQYRRGCVVTKIEMLTPKGEHFIPCFTRVMFDGRISFDGIATAKTL